MICQVHRARPRVNVTNANAEAPLVRRQNARDPRRYVSAFQHARVVRLHIKQQDLGRRRLDADQIDRADSEPGMKNVIPALNKMLSRDSLTQRAYKSLFCYVAVAMFIWFCHRASC